MPRLNTDLPPELQAAWEEIDGYARGYGLDYFPIIYQVLDYNTLYEVAAMGGFPTRYPHWRFGMEYDQLIKGHVYGLSIIYEMVINTNPVYAYLLEGNMMIDQKTVMAHVSGHADFFKHNMWFAPTNRKMLDVMANHAARIQRYIDRYGYETVESFIDTCLSLDNLIDYHAPYIRRPDAQTIVPITEDEADVPTVEGLPVERGYMRDYINPPEFVAQQQQRLREEQERLRNFPENPQKDVLLFLMNYAPLERWQHSVLEIIRDEAYYFAPQAMTKISNEGWACLEAGSLLYTERGLLPIEEIVQQREAVLVSDGTTAQRIYDWTIFEDRDTRHIRTKRGLELRGATNHRLMMPDGSWQRLDNLQCGDQVLISGGQHIWPQDYVTLDRQPQQQWTLFTENDAQDWQATSANHYSQATLHIAQPRTATNPIAPIVVDEAQAHQLGYAVNEGWAANNAAPTVPEAILRSPQTVVAAFLWACYERNGDVDETGIVLSLVSEQLSQQIQLLLLNFGILSSRSMHQNGSWHVHIGGPSARVFEQELGFGLRRKRKALRQYLAAHQWAERETWTDEVVAIEHGRATVYDISVDETHCYAAQGFVNHNSYWHSRIMTEKAANTSEIVDFADHHAGIVAAHPGRLNPYRLGLLLLRDIKQRWDKGQFGKEWDECTDLREKQSWDRKLGLGHQKLFEVRRFHNDITFIDEFLTPEFCVQNKLFTFKYNSDMELYEIVNRNFRDIKAKLLSSLTNFGQPFISVENGNYNNRGELYLRHRHEGVDLKLDYARDTLRNLFTIWSRPVHLETVLDEKRRLLTFDGRDYTERKLD